MPNTVPNQKTVIIHRDPPSKNEGNFIQIKKDNLFRAYRELNATSLVVYLYLAGNQEGYQLALSPRAISQTVGMPESTIRDQINKLIAYGYLVPKREGSSVYEFYERPQPKAEAKKEEKSFEF